MKHRTRLYSAALLLSATPLLTVSCGKKEEPGAQAGATSGNKAEVISAGSPAPVSVSTWGFAARLPKSTEGFTAVYRLGDLVTGLKNSGFLKKVFSMPAVAKEISMDKIETAWDNNADLKEAASLFQKEVVVAMPEGFTENVLKFAKLLAPVPKGFAAAAEFNAAELQKAAGTPGNRSFSQKSAWDGVVEEYQKPETIAFAVGVVADADVPPLLIALNAGSARTAIDDKLKSAMAALPPEAAKMLEPGSFKVDGKYEFQTLKLTASKAMPPEAAEGVKAQLGQLLGDPAKGAAAAEKLLAKTVEFSWGWVDDTLVLAIGKDHSHVKMVAASEGVLSLPELSSRAAAWQGKSPVSLSYSSLKTNQAVADALRGLKETIFVMMQSGAGTSPIPLGGLIADLKKLSARADELWPLKVTASAAAAWWDGGLHVESFGGFVTDAYDSSKPLTYGSLAGPATVLLSEGRVNEAASNKAFAFLEEAAGTLWTSFQTNIKPNLPPDAQTGVSMGESVLPLVKETWKNLQIFRSALGSESALLVNLDGTMPPLPNVPEELKSMKFPRILAVSDLKDRAKLGEAWSGFSKVFEALTALTTGAKGTPEPVEKKEGALTLWGLPLPNDQGDLWPHTAVSGTRFYIGTSPPFTKEISAKTPAPSGPPSGSHVHVNLKAVWDFAATAISLSPAQPEQKQHMTDAFQLLSVFDQFDARAGDDKGDTHIQLFIGVKDLK
ncbi:MAG TPA: hypothetical protein VHM91_16000 [Verrucomicrobiales bacterium]|nr:hypothetical protein [Verrucomicrobiales bacterium]